MRMPLHTFPLLKRTTSEWDQSLPGRAVSPTRSVQCTVTPQSEHELHLAMSSKKKGENQAPAKPLSMKDTLHQSKLASARKAAEDEAARKKATKVNRQTAPIPPSNPLLILLTLSPQM